MTASAIVIVLPVQCQFSATLDAVEQRDREYAATLWELPPPRTRPLLVIDNTRRAALSPRPGFPKFQSAAHEADATGGVRPLPGKGHAAGRKPQARSRRDNIGAES